MAFEFPPRGFVFWPVGTGDSTTICVDSDTAVQIHPHHLGSPEDESDPHTPIVDRLEELLPVVDGTPYLSVFVLTHPNQDHCLGFADLLSRVTIGEIWVSPRVFDEYKKDLCDDAPQLAAWAEENIPEGLTVLDLDRTEAQRKRLRTTNSLENLNQQVKRRTAVARLSPNEKSLLRLASAVLMEISKEWEAGRRYLPADDA